MRTEDLTQSRRWLSDTQRAALANVIAAGFKRIEPRDYLAKYFEDPAASERRLRLYYDGDALIGYCLLTFTDEPGATVIGASAAFLPQYRQGGRTFGFSFAHSVRYWLRRPWRKVYYADTMLSPAMYRAIARHTGVVWPSPQHAAPPALFERFNPRGTVSAVNGLRCLVPVARTGRYSDAELAAFARSQKPEIQYYLQVNPRFGDGLALFVVVPVNFRQVAATAIRVLRNRIGS